MRKNGERRGSLFDQLHGHSAALNGYTHCKDSVRMSL